MGRKLKLLDNEYLLDSDSLLIRKTQLVLASNHWIKGREYKLLLLFPFIKYHWVKIVKVILILCMSRRHRNIVSTKFNLFNLLFELLCLVLVLLYNNDGSRILYIFVKSCGTPIIYYVGIEENRTRTINDQASQKKSTNICRDVVPFCLAVRPDRSLSTL